MQRSKTIYSGPAAAGERKVIQRGRFSYEARWARGLAPVGALLVLLTALLSHCDRANDSFDPKKRYGEEVRSFASADSETLPYMVGKDFQPVWKESPEQGPLDRARKIPAFRFVDQNARAFGTRELSGKVYLANFFFTECNGICPMIMPRLRQVQQELADLSGFAQISYSVTPNVDTPEVMQKYARGLRIDQKTWHLLTGNRQEIYSLARESFGADTVVRSRQGADDFLHSEQAFLVDTEGFLRGIYNVGGAGDLERLVEDIRKLTQE